MSVPINKDVGLVTAYGYAKDGGYEGTEEQFMEDLATAKDQATVATTKATEAAASATAAETAKQYAQAFTGAPRTAATAAAMTDEDLIYVYTGSETGYTAGNWYYHNGTTWVSGGTYNSTAFTTDPTLTVSGAAADAAVCGDLKSAFNAIAGDGDISVTSMSEWAQIGTTGVYAKSDNGDLLLYGTATANRWYACINGQNFVANTSTAFSKTLDKGAYRLSIRTESAVTSLQYLVFTSSTFSSTSYWHDDEIINFTSPVMLGVRLSNAVNYGTSESPTRITFNITQYAEKADISYVDAADSSIESHIGELNNLDTTAKTNIVSAVNEVNGKTSGISYVKESAIGEVIPYGIKDSSSNILDVEQDGNIITVSGTSTASSSQTYTKILICDHSATWNASTPSTENTVFPISTINGHKYKLSIELKSSAETVTEGLNGINVYISGTGYNIAYPLRYFTLGHTYDEYTFAGNGNPICLLLRVGRTTTLNNAVFEVKLSDITFDVLNTTINNQTALKTESIISKATLNKYWADQDGVAVQKDYSGAYSAFAPIEVATGDRLLIHIYGGNSSNQNPVFVVTENYTIMSTEIGTRSAWNDFDITIPNGAKYLLLTTTTTTNAIKAACSKVVGIRPITSYEGCKLSLLGDSFSAIDGYCDHNYYPNVGSDVYSGEQMWWKIVANQLGMTPLVIGGWSGSCVTDGIRDGYTPASDPARCEALGVGDETPDVVLIAMGVNDYSYMSTESQFGTWDGTTALGSESDLSDYDTNTFKTAYATMLARIQRAYPNAFIVAITPWFQKRRSTDTGANYINAIGKSIYDYAEAVREICGIMHVPVINGTDIGFNRRNYYPTYSSDSASTTTHPTIAGQAQIAKAITEQLKTLHRLGT